MNKMPFGLSFSALSAAKRTRNRRGTWYQPECICQTSKRCWAKFRARRPWVMPGQALGDRGLAHTSLHPPTAGCFFCAGGWDPGMPLDLVLGRSGSIFVFGELVGFVNCSAGMPFVGLCPLRFVLRFGCPHPACCPDWVALANAVGDEVHHIRRVTPCWCMMVNSVRIFLAKIATNTLA
jgi:hypothetical protein